MKRRFFVLLILLAAILPARASLDSLLTGIDTIDKLKLTESSQEYISNDLFVMIDGGAETYLEYGFQKALEAKFLFDSSQQIAVQIYQMTDDGAAFGIFSSSRNEGDQKQEIGDFSSGNDYYLMVQKGIYYYVVSAEETNQQTHEAVIKIANLISDNINEKGSLPEIVKKGIAADFNTEKLKYIRGKIALSSNYFFTHKEIFKSRDAIYTETGDSKIFIFQYTDNASAISNLKLINDELVASGRYTQFQTDSNKISCLDKNLKPVNLWISHKYVIVTVGKNPDNELLSLIEKYF
jgi:hypothetical protein